MRFSSLFFSRSRISRSSEIRKSRRLSAYEIGSPRRVLPALLAFGLIAGLGSGCSHAAVTLTPISAPPAVSPIEQSWVELGAKAEWIVRSVSVQKDCPLVDVDGRAVALELRATTTQNGAKVLICELRLPHGAKSVIVMGHRHNLSLDQISRIAVIGDTGCRIKAHGEKFDVQNCNSEDEWPFHKMVTEQVLAQHPDLIVHVGDYHYRESACPEGNESCAGAIAGDNVNSWQQDFFEPAAEALNQANWFFVRGNHEICARAGASWFRFLDTGEYQNACSDATAPVVATIGDVTLVAVDAANDHNIQPSLNQLALTKSISHHTLIFLHRPFLTVGADDEATVKSHLPASLLRSPRIDAVITGHKHYFSFNEFHHGPSEIISGNGGTKLLAPEASVPIKDHWTHTQTSGVEKSAYWQHGFLTLDREGSGWIASEHDVNGKVIFTHPVRAQR